MDARRWIAGVLALLTLVIYLPVRNHEFIDYDDNAYVYENPLISQGFTAAGVRFAFLELHGKETYWHPLTWLSHMLDCQLFGVNAGPQHLVNVLFHIANTVLLFLGLASLTGRLWRSAVVAMLFAWHPLQVDTVAWIAERKNLLSALFWILALWAYTRWAREGRRRDYFAALGLYALGLMCKPAIVTLPCVLLLLDFWPLRRIEFPSPTLTKSLRPLLLEKLPFFALTVISSFITVQAHQGLGLLHSMERLSLLARLANALGAYALYVRNVVWPTQLALVYPFVPQQSPTLVALGVLVVAAPLIWGLAIVRKQPQVLMGWLWFLGTLVPTIGIVQAGYQALADRFVYLPLIGLFIVAVWTAGEVAARFGTPVRMRFFATGIIAAACLGLTTRQLGFWKDSQTAFEHAVSVTKNNWVAFEHLGVLAIRRGDPPAAITHFLELARVHPNRPAAQFILGSAYAKAFQFREAEARYRRAFELDPADARILYGLGFITMQQGRLSEAQEFFNQSLAIDPNHAEARKWLALIVDGTAKTFEAIAQAEAKIERDPANLETRLRAADLLTVAGRFKEADAHYEKILAQQPAEPRALAGLGASRAREGRLPEATELFERALAADPKSATANHQLGMIRARTGRVDEALTHYEAAVQTKPDFADAWTNLGLLLARVGKMPAAFEAFEHAATIQPQNPDFQLRAGLLASNLQRAAAAQRYLREASRLRPDWPPPLNARAWLLATHPDPQSRNGMDAVKLARRACELTEDRNVVYLDVLAAALAEAGDFAGAVATLQTALARASAANPPIPTAEYSARLQLYQAGMPYHQAPLEAVRP